MKLYQVMNDESKLLKLIMEIKGVVLNVNEQYNHQLLHSEAFRVI